MPNRLAQATSAYLRSAASQPIDWHEFGEAAFERAKELDRPVLLDIGAVWCHWCHVIDRESYENEAIAELINQYYVPVKVDRDQRPDVDARYQQVVQAVSGQGGWPLTAFLTYDGRLIYGGTYFPPDAMKNLLQRVHRIYQERKTDIFSEEAMPDEGEAPQMENVLFQPERLKASEAAEAEPDLKALCAEFLDDVLRSVYRAYEPEFGGFGARPKFPHFSALEWMIRRVTRNADDGTLRRMLVHTLTRMAQGGIYDQIAGGFHRYSVDERWHVPHFEKMAYDNAEGLAVYSQAFRLTGLPLLKETAEGIVAWVAETLYDADQGGFYASQDADIDLHDDGDHFTWSPNELAEVLTPSEAEVIRLAYDVDEAGDMHHAQGRNVLYVHDTPEGILKRLKHEGSTETLTVETVTTLLKSARAKMLDQRRRRPKPFVDTSLYVNWNGMMIAACFEAADCLDLPEAGQMAQRSLDRMLREFRRDDGAVLHAAGVDGFLEDYAWLAWAALQGYRSLGEAAYLEAAREIANRLLERFEDPAAGGFYDIPHTGGAAFGLLRFKRKPGEDNPSSSANAIALRVMQALTALTAEDRYQHSLEKGLGTMIRLYGAHGLYAGALASVADACLHPPLRLEVTGREPAFTEAARRAFYPGKLVAYHPEESPAEIRVCLGEQCLAPVREAERLEEALTGAPFGA